MRIKIEGCTAEALNDYCSYLTLSKEYEVVRDCYADGELLEIIDDDGDTVAALMSHPEVTCAHLPSGAKWVMAE